MKRQALTIALALIALAITAHNAFGKTTADEWIQKGKEYYDKADYANAITACSEAIKRDSSNIYAYWLRGVSYLQIKNYNAAIADYNVVIKDSPDFSDAYRMRSTAYYYIKNYDAAIADNNMIIKIKPNSSDGYILRGDAYGAKGIYHKAVEDFKTSLEKGYDPSRYSVDKSSKSDMWFCGAMYMEILVNRFLGKSDVVAKYENWLKTVSDKNKVTRQEIEAFYRDNIRALIAGVVDEEFKGITVPSQTVTYVKQSLANFFTTPNQANYNILKNIYDIKYYDISRFQNQYSNELENAKIYDEMGMSKSAEAARNLVRSLQNILTPYRRTLNVPNNEYIDWDEFGQAYYEILDRLNPELFRKMR